MIFNDVLTNGVTIGITMYVHHTVDKVQSQLTFACPRRTVIAMTSNIYRACMHGYRLALSLLISMNSLTSFILMHMVSIGDQ